MDVHTHSPHGGDRGAAPPRDLTPRLAKRYFEFFKPGTHREVLLLGDLVWHESHWIKSKGYKVPCGAQFGACELCLRNDTSDDIGPRQTEYLAPTMIRPWRDREFQQRVAVFTAVAGDIVRGLLPEGQQRGRRVEVSREQSKNSTFKIVVLDGLPAGFPDTLPAAFDLVPFIRARFGKPQDLARPLIFLPPIKCGGPSTRSRPAGRPRSLDLSPDDCAPVDEMTPEEAERLLAKINADPEFSWTTQRERCERVLREAGRPVPPRPSRSGDTAPPEPAANQPPAAAAVLTPPPRATRPAAVGAAGAAPAVFAPDPAPAAAPARPPLVVHRETSLTEAELDALARTGKGPRILKLVRVPAAPAAQPTLADKAIDSLARKGKVVVEPAVRVEGGEVVEVGGVVNQLLDAAADARAKAPAAPPAPKPAAGKPRSRSKSPFTRAEKVTFKNGGDA